MKKVIATLIVLFSVSLVAHANINQTIPVLTPTTPMDAGPNATEGTNKNKQQPNIDNEDSNTDEDSNDDDANTINDPDPEADVDSNAGSPTAQQS